MASSRPLVNGGTVRVAARLSATLDESRDARPGDPQGPGEGGGQPRLRRERSRERAGELGSLSRQSRRGLVTGERWAGS